MNNRTARRDTAKTNARESLWISLLMFVLGAVFMAVALIDNADITWK